MQNKEINDATFNQSWDSFGKFISSKLRQGRGVKVPGFGVFTFSAPFVRLNVTQNMIKIIFFRALQIQKLGIKETENQSS